MKDEGTTVSDIILDPPKEEVQEVQQLDTMDSPSLLFGLYYPKFVQGVDMLSNKSLRRVLKALVGVPLEDVLPNLKRKDEEMVYQIGERCLQAKWALTLITLMEEEAKRNSNNKGETTNGMEENTSSERIQGTGDEGRTNG